MKDRFIPKMVGNMIGSKRFNKLTVPFFKLLHIARIVKIGASYRMKNKRIRRLFSLRQRRTEQLEMLLIVPIVFLPRIMLGIMIGIVAFSLSPLGIGI